MPSSTPSERLDDPPAGSELPPIGFPPVLDRPLPRRMRSVLHAAETHAKAVSPEAALAWFLAAGVTPPQDWLLNVATSWPCRTGTAWEYLGHAIRSAATDGNREALREIARRAAAPLYPPHNAERELAELAARAAEGTAEVLRDAVREAERYIRTVRINLDRVNLPPAADFAAPPLEVPQIAPVDAISAALFGRDIEEEPDRFNALVADAYAYPLIYRGARFLRRHSNYPQEYQPFPRWAWRYFEAAEHLRDLGLARDA